MYERKVSAVKALFKDYFEGVDYTTQNVDNFASPVGEAKTDNRGGSNKVTYYLTVSCLEHLIARKERRVFEVYSQVFHQAMDNASSQPQVLRDIRNILSQLEDGAERNFALSEYTDAKGVAETNFGPGSYKDMYNLMK